MMYFHYIIIIDVEEKTYVYHYSSQSGEEMNKGRERFSQSIKGLTKLYGMHMLKTDGPSFESVQAMDPYFKGMIAIEDLKKFREKYVLYLDSINLLKEKV